MFKKIAMYFSIIFLSACASTSPSSIYKDSLRTDGVYESVRGTKAGERAYIHFFVSSEGEKYFKSNIMKGYDPEKFNKGAEIIKYFSVNPEKQEIKYTIDSGGVRAYAVTDMSNFKFIPDNKM
ncbi:MAG: hypothetical protein CL581_12575 [Alteromonadaceae bacterium]|nr:hypothetical protein [Alteromonadaceae bacterium]MBH86214.1 hypothetical protein [Alteromonadaceae bacterium]|tara:strand:- start:528 stop:896 length:369 start_codon:yes stop_codon:yes gene_type:complete